MSKTSLEMDKEIGELDKESNNLFFSPAQKKIAKQGIATLKNFLKDPEQGGLSNELIGAISAVASLTGATDSTSAAGGTTDLSADQGNPSVAHHPHMTSDAAAGNLSLEGDADDKNKGDLEKDPHKSMATKTGDWKETDPIKVFFEQLLNMLLKITPIVKATQQHAHNIKTHRHNKIVDKVEQLDEFESGVGQNLAQTAKLSRESYSKIKEDIDNGSKLTNALVNNKQLNALLTKQEPESPDKPLNAAQKKHNVLADKRSNYSNQIHREMYTNSAFKENFAACSPVAQQQALDKLAAHIVENITTPKEVSKKDIKDAKAFVKDLTSNLRELAAREEFNKGTNKKNDEQASGNTAQQTPSPKTEQKTDPKTTQVADAREKDKQSFLNKIISTFKPKPSPPTSHNNKLK
jgi:hypothetical protein